MSNYNILSISQTMCCIEMYDPDTSQPTTVSFTNTSNNLGVLQDMLSETDYIRVQTKWASSVISMEPDQVSNDVLSGVRNSVIEEMDRRCHEIIEAGFDATMSDNKSHHFSLKTEDQLMIQALMIKVNAGETVLRYHADGETCRYYTPEEITILNTNMEEIITYNVTYFNSLRDYINSLQDIDSIYNVYYGMEIPEQYQSVVLVDLTSDK